MEQSLCDGRVAAAGALTQEACTTKGDAEGADELEILDRLEEQGFSRANGEKYLQQLSKDGRIFSPAHGRWRTM